MLSYSPSNLPIAIDKSKKIVYYHPEEKTDYVQYDKYDEGLSQEEKDNVYKVINGHQESKFPGKALLYYQEAKKNHKSKIAKELSGIDFKPIPQEKENQRQFILVTGSSGAGKSTFTADYMVNYHKMFPNNPIFIFSKKDSDPAYDSLNFITRVPLDEEFVEMELDTDYLRDSLCVFDDIENIFDKAIKTKVYQLKDSLAETGRSFNIYMILCNHLAMNGNSTRKDLNECDAVVVFKSSSNYHIENLLRKYVGLDKNQITEIKDLKSRWVFIKKDVPMYVVSENKVILL